MKSRPFKFFPPLALWVVSGLAMMPAFALEFSEGYVRGLPPTQKNTAAFFRVTNPTTTDWELVRVTSVSAASIEIHEHIHSGDIMQMRPRESLVVPAGGSRQFKPGGLHLMLLGLVQPLREGDKVTLHFESATGERETVVFPVVSVVNEHHRHNH